MISRLHSSLDAAFHIAGSPVKLRVSLLRYAIITSVIAVLLAITLQIIWPSPHVERIKVPGTGSEFSNLPPNPVIERQSESARTYYYKIRFAPGDSTIFRIIPKQCILGISVNGAAFQTEKQPGGCNNMYGSIYDFSVALQPGDNVIGIYGGPKPMDIPGEPHVAPIPHTQTLGFLLLFAVGIHVMLTAWANRAGIDRLSYLAVHLSIGLGLYHLAHTPYFHLAHDIWGHTEYIKTIYLQHQLPKPLGWQTHQPPLYYVLNALLFALENKLPISDPWLLPRLFSITLHAGFLMYAVGTFFLLLKERRLPYFLAVLMLACWPSLINASARVNNDQMSTFWQAFVIYYAFHWHFKRNPNSLLMAIIGACFAVATKGTGIILLASTGLIALYALWKQQLPWKTLFTRRWVAGGVLGLSCVLSYFGRTFYYKVIKHENILWLLNNTNDPRIVTSHYVENHWSQFLTFEIGKFITRPFFWSGGKDNVENAWNSLFKTMLFDEWSWPYMQLASAMCALLVLMIGATIWQLFRRSFQNPEFRVAGLFTFLMIFALMSARYDFPWVNQNHARYAFGLIIFVIACTAKTVQEIRPRGIRAVACLLMLFFTIASASQLIAQH